MIKIPYSKKSRYKHYRQKKPSLFIRESFKTVPLNHTKYNGKKFASFNVSGTKAKAIVGTYKKNGKKGVIQSILIPKEDIEEVSGYTRKAPTYKKTTQKVNTYLRKKRKKNKKR